MPLTMRRIHGQLQQPTTHNNPPPAQAALPLRLPPPPEHQVLEAMREHFNLRWRRWHRCKTFEAAMSDELTARLLRMSVLPPKGLPLRERLPR